MSEAAPANFADHPGYISVVDGSDFMRDVSGQAADLGTALRWIQRPLDSIEVPAPVRVEFGLKSDGRRFVEGVTLRSPEPDDTSRPDMVYVLAHGQSPKPTNMIRLGVAQELLGLGDVHVLGHTNPFHPAYRTTAAERAKLETGAFDSVATDQARFLEAVGFREGIVSGWSLGGVMAVPIGRAALDRGIDVHQIVPMEPLNVKRTPQKLRKDFLADGDEKLMQAVEGSGFRSLKEAFSPARRYIDYGKFGVALYASRTNQSLQRGLAVPNLGRDLDGLHADARRRGTEPVPVTYAWVADSHMVDSVEMTRHIVDRQDPAHVSGAVLLGSDSLRTYGHATGDHPIKHANLLSVAIRRGRVAVDAA